MIDDSPSIDTIKKEVRLVFPYTIPVLTGFLILGMTYGLLMQTKGYNAFYSTLMSMLAFCGSMQFVAIALLTTIFDPLQAFLLSFMVNARHIFYGLAMLNKYKGMGKIKNFLIFTLCDETFSIISSMDIPASIKPKSFYFYISLLNYLYWISGTLIGGLLGKMIVVDIRGLDFVLTALFVVLFLHQMKRKENQFYGYLGIIVTLVWLVILGPKNFIIPSMITILSLLVIKERAL